MPKPLTVSVQFQFISVTQPCPTLCNPMNFSTPGLPVHHQLPEFTQTHIHRVSDAIQPSHPLSSPFPPVPNHNKLENSSRDGNTRHLTCLLRNLYVGQEATVRTGHGTMEPMDFPNGSKLGKEYIKVTLLI